MKPSVNRGSRIAFGLALAAVLTGALGLAACGRKGPLDPPPSAALPPPPTADMSHPAPPGAGAPPAATAVAAPSAAAPPQKTFFLDFLLAK